MASSFMSYLSVRSNGLGWIALIRRSGASQPLAVRVRAGYLFA